MSISKNSQNLSLDLKRHSFAHLMAAAAQQMFPEAQFGVGPVIENGCYYDFVLPRPLIPEDLPLIEAKMKEMLKQPLAFKVQEVELSEAIALFEKMNQPLKVELLNDLATRGTTSMSEEEKADFNIHPNPPSKEGDRNQINLEKGGIEYDISIESRLYFALNSVGKRPFNFDIVNYNKALNARSQDLRNNQTKSEKIFWDEVRKDTKLSDLTWNRQKPIGSFIADFYCRELNLVVEIDGSSHDNKEDYDFERDNIIKSQSLEILRFENKEIEDNIKQVLENIYNWSFQKSPFYDPKVHVTNSPFQGGQGDVVYGLPKITIYRLENEKTGEDLFVDLCKGPHVEGREGFAELRACGFSLDKFSASYWRGDQARGINMQRLYALIFDTKEELKEFESKREEAKKRDHRLLGQQMEIFMISEDVGAGLPLYLPNGAEIRQLLEKYCYQEAKKSGYQYVYTPHIGKSDLFAKSGHLDHYADGMYAPIDMVNLKGEGALEGGKTEKFYLKPMNCPMHHQIYLNRPRSYKELPYRLYEYGTVYRYEESGTLTGMIRVRGFTQNDAHVYCQTNQLKEVISEALNRFIKAYNDIGISEYKMRFSLPDFVNDKEKYGEETQEWIEAVSAMRQVLDELGVDYYEAIGEAAFYGPKIDIQVKNVNGKEDSLSTIQVDYSIAPKFGITFKNNKGEDEVPAIIHMALMGSIDRFMAFMLEMTAGRLPFWLAPNQIKILTINNEQATTDYVEKIKQILDEVVLMKPLKYNELRYSVDDRSESLGKKIREATNEKVPVMLIVGPKDVEAGEVSVRTQEGEEKVKLEELGEFLKGLS